LEHSVEVVKGGSPAGATKFVYDYFIKDHLGNVRTTLAAEPASHEYYARHEIATANSEQLLFDNIALVRDDKPGSINADDLKAARLNADDPDRRIGTAIMLRVMPGDQFTFPADAYYEADDNPVDYEHTTAEEIVSSLLATLSGGTVGGEPVGETENGALINELFSRPETVNGIQDLINSSTISGTAPRAGLNYLFFDEQMNLLSGNGRLSIGSVSPGIFDNLSTERVSMTEPGFVIVYVDNQTMGKDVWFDNVQVLHYNTQVLEENHYYPFGLTISSTAAGVTGQPYKYQGIELERHFGLETYETFYRGLDPQLGRFNSIDTKSELVYSMSPYVAMGNNPVIYTDFLGDIFTFASSSLENRFKDLKNENNIRMSSYINELGGLDINSTDKSVQDRIAVLNGLINSHAQFNSQLDAMDKSSVEFHVSNLKSTVGAAGAFYNWGERKVQFNMGSDNPSLANLSHEFRHGYGFLVGELSGTRYDDPLYDMTDEVVAYKTALLFGSTPSAAVDGSYGLDQFKKGIETGFGYQNLRGRESSLTVGSPASLLLNYSTDGALNNFIKNSNNINLTTEGALNGFNDLSKKATGVGRYLWGESLKRK